MNAPITPLALDLARHYIAILHEELTAEDIAEAAARNTAETDPNIDHMADFTDTNEVLLMAWQRLTGTELEFNPEDEENIALLNTTLSLAKRAGFRTTVALAIHLHDAGHRLDKKTKKLADPTKRLVAEEIATTYGVEIQTARAAIHMVHVWSLGLLPVGTADKI